eukprot:CAMPEP_0170466532 /NCGR_PEP_ID=MMETSP0123-20130129/10457_1 /TAXON_ID=182087 /ORGANISM="Favella ehrenbergii, Strain Fehren 1" /LENGTH=117 /DNA_ID=CAMNT_0010732685 /DNA_START=771 /DNA_END=1124 /DNA_ORIENTATION=+
MVVMVHDRDPRREEAQFFLVRTIFVRFFSVHVPHVARVGEAHAKTVVDLMQLFHRLALDFGTTGPHVGYVARFNQLKGTCEMIWVLAYSGRIDDVACENDEVRLFDIQHSLYQALSL